MIAVRPRGAAATEHAAPAAEQIPIAAIRAAHVVGGYNERPVHGNGIETLKVGLLPRYSVARSRLADSENGSPLRAVRLHQDEKCVFVNATTGGQGNFCRFRFAIVFFFKVPER
jgi:hypothetical protein